MNDLNLKHLHLIASVKRHAIVPWLWRSDCTCGIWFLAGTEHLARKAIETHISSEDPFPDMGLAPDAKEEP